MASSDRSLVIVDTNILISVAQSRSIPSWLQSMAKHEKRDKVTLVFPQTVVLELEHKRNKQIAEEKLENQKAAKMLRDAGAIVDDSTIDYREDFSIADELEQLGFLVKIEEPDINDFNQALRRSCLHLFPIGNEDKESTKDLTILAIAERLAETNPNTILAANDNLFHKMDTDGEQGKLIRVRSLEGIFPLLTPDSSEIASLVQALIPKLKKAGITKIKSSDIVWKRIDIDTMVRNADDLIASATANVELASRQLEPGHIPETLSSQLMIALTIENTYKIHISTKERQDTFEIPAPRDNSEQTAKTTKVNVAAKGESV